MTRAKSQGPYVIGTENEHLSISLKVRFIWHSFFQLVDGFPKCQAWKMGDQLRSVISGKKGNENFKQMVNKDNILEILKKLNWENLDE